MDTFFTWCQTFVKNLTCIAVINLAKVIILCCPKEEEEPVVII